MDLCSPGTRTWGGGWLWPLPGNARQAIEEDLVFLGGNRLTIDKQNSRSWMETAVLLIAGFDPMVRGIYCMLTLAVVT